MLINLTQIKNSSFLAEVLEHPAAPEDHVLYVTDWPDFAGMLIEKNLPCIFLEREPCGIFGADMVILQQHSEEEWDWRKDDAFLERIWRRHYDLPWTIAETQRLLIRETVEEDLPELLEIYRQEEGNRDVQPFSEEPEEELRAYIRNRYRFYGYGLWTVAEKGSQKIIGRIGFEDYECEEPSDSTLIPEMEYVVRREYRGRGFALEAAMAVLDYGRQQYGFEDVILRVSPENVPSRKLAERLGFCPAGSTEDGKRVFLEIHLK